MRAFLFTLASLVVWGALLSIMTGALVRGLDVLASAIVN